MTHHNPFIKGLTFTVLMLLGGVASAQVVIEGNVYGGGNIGQVVAYGFYHLDGKGNKSIDPFKVTEFAPLIGEEDGALHAGIRW